MKSFRLIKVFKSLQKPINIFKAMHVEEFESFPQRLALDGHHLLGLDQCTVDVPAN